MDVADGGVKIAPAKTPDFVLYSGSNVLYSAFKTKALTRAGEQDVITAEEITTTSLDYTTETTTVTNKLNEGVNNSAEINTDFLYKADEDLTVDLYFITGQNKPATYTGEVIPSEYWTREPADCKDYTLYTHVNTLDCQVVPTDEGFTKTSDEVYNKVYTK